MKRPVQRLLPIAALATALALSSAWLNAAPAAQTQAAATVPVLQVGAERPAAAAVRPDNAQAESAVAWNGSVFYVVWTEAPRAGGQTQIYGARVSASGTVLDPGGVLLSLSANNHAHPRVAGGNGRFLVVWEEQPEGTYTDLGAALVTGAGAVQKRWTLNATDNDQQRPDVTWNGKLFMVAWMDQPDVEDFDIYATRVTLNGLTLDGCSGDSCPNGDDPGISLGDPDGDQRQPAIASNPDTFVVVWQDLATPAAPDIRGGRLAINAELLDPTPFTVSQATGAQTDPAIARNGAVMLVAWADGRSGTSSDVFSTRIKPGADLFSPPSPLPPAGRAVSNGAGEQTQPTVVRRGSGFVVAWTDNRGGNDDVRASRVARDGTVLDATGVVVAGSVRDENFPATADAGAVQLVAYERDVIAAPFSGVDRVFFRLLS